MHVRQVVKITNTDQIVGRVIEADDLALNINATAIGFDAAKTGGKAPAAASGLATLGATSIVVQQPPPIAASKVTSGRFGMVRMPDIALDKVMVGQGAGNSPVEEDKPMGILDSEKLTVTGCQTTPATGTCANPEMINDGALATRATYSNPNEYTEIDLGDIVALTQYRSYGGAGHAQDGRYKIQYWHLGTQAWTDWVTDIPTRLAVWSDWATVFTIKTTKVRIVATTIDSAGWNKPGEFEMKY